MASSSYVDFAKEDEHVDDIDMPTEDEEDSEEVSFKPIKCYILNSTYFVDSREKNIESLKALLSDIADISVISDFDPSELSNNFIQSIVNYAIVDKPELGVYNQFRRSLHINNVSNSMKHIQAFRDIVREGEDENVMYLVLEDDAIPALINSEMVAELTKMVIDEADKTRKHDVVSIAAPYTTGPSLMHEYQVFTTAYLVTSFQSAFTLMKEILPIKFSHDIQMSYVMRRIGLAYTTIDKPLFLDGSKTGKYLSYVEATNHLTQDEEYMRALQNPEDPPAFEEDGQLSPAAKCAHSFANARHLISKQEYIKAQKELSVSYKILMDNRCIVNQETDTLKMMIGLCKFVCQA